MIEAGLFPAARVVATGAIGAILALVRIIPGMTSKAGARRVLVGVSGPVARSAGGIGMAADQREPCGTVIECCRLPVAGIMATCAVGTAAALVSIIAGVASDTAGAKALPALADMAAKAGHGLVRSSKGKPGYRMIEALHLLPGRGVVAILASAAELALVRIEWTVTTGAILRPTAIIVTPVATTAIGASMRSGQREIGEGVVKAGAVELD
jgi:hypothetical protein